MKKIIYGVILFSQLLTLAWAQAFVVQNIKVEGLQRTTPATVESYLPIKRGQTLEPSKTSAIIRSLYKTGFFDHISLSRSGNTLIIHVVERPTIGRLKVTGNSVIPTDKLTTVMKSLDIAEGRVYNPVIIERIKQSLLNQYYQLGRYNAVVNVTTAPMSRNRVAVDVHISEGAVTKVKRITIIGNHVFDESTLLKKMDLTTSGLFTFVTQTDRYSEEKLEMSVDKIRSYYMDHGYIRFEVRSAQAQMTPDRKSAYITIVINEGSQYTVKQINIEGNSVISREQVASKISLKPGDVFSRQKALDSQKAITKLYGNQGYMLAVVSIHPQVRDETHDVILNFDIKPGKRSYVRHITFSDNNRTNDEVLRREILQFESAPASASKLEDSKLRLMRQRYIREVDMSFEPVPGSSDEVDVNYKVKENNSAEASFKVGYSQIDRVILGLGFNQKNFMGTGNTFGITLSHSKYEQFYGMEYMEPYYTVDGISRAFNLSVSRVDPRGAGINNGYTTHVYNGSVLYGIPIGNEDNVINQIQAGVGYVNTLVHLIQGGVSNQINTFVTAHGTHFQQLDFKLGYVRDSRDKALFPTSGTVNNLFADAFAPLSSGSVSYYTLSYQGKWYQPIYGPFILYSKANLAYGNGFHGIGDFPFFSNYYAGGITSVRGYQGYTLGPRDSNGKPYGGNMLADGSVALIFPNYISDDLRTSVYYDIGNVYTSLNMRSYGGRSSDSGPLRTSVGVEADWLTPLGWPIQLSLAKTLNRKTGPHDQVEAFQFAMGTNF